MWYSKLLWIKLIYKHGVKFIYKHGHESVLYILSYNERQIPTCQ